ncbi:ArsR/SmtB family transcription factor [Ruegeria halocynthiae]|uniref:ArsR/SmtB family transcription factor n=1 Tax=Ruegeria halocynthiae TaxID=985054 RepID=UPI0009431BCB|nr:helix-turn-helix domain-containing protein [Ruegeria halocynthiae]
MKDDQLDLMFKALSDSTRRRIIDRLSKKTAQSLFEVCAAPVAENGVALSRQTVSQYLAVLEKAGLIKIAWNVCTKTHSISISKDHIATASWLNRYDPKGTKTSRYT